LKRDHGAVLCVLIFVVLGAAERIVLK